MAGPVLLSRVAAAILRGHMDRHKWCAGTCFGNNPHIYHGYAGLLDIDMMYHMNNASYLTHAELARWELFSQSGMIHWAKSKNARFIFAAASIRYRREIKAFKSFDIHTRILGADDKSIFISQVFQSVDCSQLLAQYITRAIIRGPDIIPPRDFLTAIGADHELIERAFLVRRFNFEVCAQQAMEVAQKKTASAQNI